MKVFNFVFLLKFHRNYFANDFSLIFLCFPLNPTPYFIYLIKYGNIIKTIFIFLPIQITSTKQGKKGKKTSINLSIWQENNIIMAILMKLVNYHMRMYIDLRYKFTLKFILIDICHCWLPNNTSCGRLPNGLLRFLVNFSRNNQYKHALNYY